MNSIISWVGGKRLLRKDIIPMIPKHQIYCEVFGGAAWVLFGKSANKKDWVDGRVPYTEVYNDINGELVNFWRMVKLHPFGLAAELKRELVSREVFDEYKADKARTEMERAVRFYYTLGCSYGSQSKNFCILKGARYLPLRFNDRIEEASTRLANVIIERMDWKDLISRYDTAETVFYLDPPYWQHEHLYRRDDAERFDEHEELAKRLAGIKGKFLLSYNDCEEIRRLYEWARVKEVTAQYSVSGGRTNEIELIIGNW